MLQDVYPVLSQEYKVKKEMGGSVFNYKAVLIIIFGFLMGQAEIAGLFPLALVYLTILVFINPGIFLASLITVSAGLIRIGNLINLIYVIPAFIGFIIYRKYKDKYQRLDIAMVNTCLYMILAFARNYYLNTILVYYFFSAGEIIAIYILSYIGLQGMKQLYDRQSSLTRLALITVLMLSSGFLIGLSNLEMVPLELINIIIYLLIFSMSNILGFNYTVLGAVFFSIVMVNIGIIPLIKMFIFIIFSFSCSLFKGKKKGWIIIGALMGFLLYSGLSPSIYDLQRTSIELIIALAVYILVPLKYWSLLYYSLIDKPKEKENQLCPALNKGLKQHLSELSRVFNELSVTFKETAPVEDINRELNDFSFIFNNKVCGKCKRKVICWQQEKDDTYKRLFLLLKYGEKKTFLGEEIIEKYFFSKCPYIEKIIWAVKESYEIYQINKFWRDRLMDKQNIVSEQLSGIGVILEQFSAETFMSFSGDLTVEDIKRKVKENNLDLLSIDIHGNINNNKNYYTIKMEQCSGNCPCQGQFLDLLNSYYDYNYRVIEKSCGNKLKDRPCEIVYGPVGPYRFSIAHFLKASSDDLSGDSFLYKGLKDGKELVVISDGMGVGKKAAVESRAAIDLLESIIDAGFDQNLAIKTVNSALFLRNQEESFTTLDICIFDTFTGKAVFSKIGAVDSYVKRDWELIKIDSASLPVGILEKIEVSHREIELELNDFIIMFTDGMLDIRDDIDNKEEWLRQLLQNSSFDRAEDMLDYLREAVLDFNGEISDDLTIVVVKVEEVEKKRRKFNGLSRIKIGI